MVPLKNYTGVDPKHNIAAARAVDREFNSSFGSYLGAGDAGGCAPPHPPAFRGAPPPDPPKGASRPWLQRLFAFSQPNHLSGAELFLRNPTFFDETTCPGQLRCLGQNFSQKLDFFLNKPLVPGSFAAWGRTFSQKVTFFFEQATCPGQLRCLGQNFSQTNDFFLNKPLAPGSFAAWGRTFSQKMTCSPRLDF